MVNIIDNKTIGLFIKELREKKNLNQGELADLLYVDRTLVNKWEHGKVSLTSQNLIALSEFFNVSTEELLSGKLLTKENEKEVKNVKYKIYDERRRLKKQVKTFMLAIALLVVSFLAYFFFTFYNSVSMYKVKSNISDIGIYNGLLIKMKDYIIFKLDIDSDEDVSKIKLYYKEDKTERIIINVSNSSSIYLIDHYDLQEYFDFKKFNKIIDNMYVKFDLKNGKSETDKLVLFKTYVNNRISIKNKVEKMYITDYKEEDLNKKMKTIKELYYEKKFVIDIDKIKYDTYFMDDVYIIINGNLKIVYNFKNQSIYKTYNDDKKYIYSLQNKKCFNGDCSKIKEDIKLINKIIDKILKNGG